MMEIGRFTAKTCFLFGLLKEIGGRDSWLIVEYKLEVENLPKREEFGLI
jgi:hypothetical protein